MTIDTDRVRTFVQRAWDDDIVPALTEYIRIPAKSPMFDAQWADGLLAQVLADHGTRR